MKDITKYFTNLEGGKSRKVEEQPLNDNERAVVLIRDGEKDERVVDIADPQAVASLLGDVVNSTRIHATENEVAFTDQIVYGTHRTLQQSLYRLFAATIRAWASCKPQGVYDGRNEVTVEQSAEIVEKVENFGITPFI